MSQIFYLALSFCFMKSENEVLENEQMLPVSLHKIKTKAQIKNLRDSSLHLNVFNPCLKFHIHNLHIKRDIYVKKIKV